MGRVGATVGHSMGWIANHLVTAIDTVAMVFSPN